MSNHTPGDWKAVEARKNEWIVCTEDLDLARILHNGKPHPKGKRGMNQAMAANAHLMAAAPAMRRELLRCAIDLGGWMEREDIPPDLARELADRSQGIAAAIAKAEREG